jgi:outer membrane lipoprotein-sorting protein
MKNIVRRTFLLIASLSAPVVQAQERDVAAESLLQHMAQAYAAVSSYSDSGSVHGNDKDGPDPSSVGFRIYFSRADGFRFDLTNNVGSPHFPPTHKVLWCKGKESYQWWQDFPEIVTNRDVFSGISGFTGISSRSAHNIPSLLETNFGWQEYLYQISSPKVVGDEVVDGTDCFRVRGKGRAGRTFEIWLSKSDYFVRKIKTTYPDLSHEEIHRGIEINQQISRNVFNLSPEAPSETSTNKTSGNRADGR